MQLGFACWPLMRFTSDRAKMGEFVNGWWVKALGWTITLLIIALNVKLLVDTLLPETWTRAIYGLVGASGPS
jgi:manganese transport protein